VKIVYNIFEYITNSSVFQNMFLLCCLVYTVIPL